MAKKYKHILWDLDHTLWDFEKNSIASLKQLFDFFDLQSKGISTFDDFEKAYHIHNDKLWERFRKGFINREMMRWKRMSLTLIDFKIIDEPLAKEMGEKYLEYLPLQTHLFEDTIEILEYCKAKNYKQHIITNGFEATQMQKMTNSNILHYFDAIITSEKAMCMKPQVEIYNYTLLQINAQKDECIMIGDALNVDVLGAINTEIDGVWFNPNKIVQDGPRTHEINTLKEMMQII
jgi:putative hydrolase of the HAD superfamily